MMGAMYGAMLFIGINNCPSVQPFVDVEHQVFCREKDARMYYPIVYALAQVRNPSSIESDLKNVESLLDLFLFNWHIFSTS